MAAAGFRTRRIKTDGLSIGDRLKRARTRLKLSIGEVEEATKIRGKFLQALEGDSWELIPSEVYGRCYLESYASFLKLDGETIMRDYDRIRGVYARTVQDATEPLMPKRSFHLPRFTFTARGLMITGLAVALLGFAGVIGYQLNRYAAQPYLEIVSPALAQSDTGPGLIANASTMTVTGRTIPGAVVHVNGQLAQVQMNGDFSYQLSLQKGVNAIVVESIGQNGRKTTEASSVMVK